MHAYSVDALDVSTPAEARDDPAQVRQAIPPAERARWTVRLIAACVVLYGRARLDAFGRRS